LLISLTQLRKRYGALEALSEVSVEVSEGTIGLLGPNGAGKTTLIKILLGLLEPSDGRAEVLGHRVPDEALEVRRRVGYMPEEDCYLPYISAVEFVTQIGRLSGMPRNDAFGRAHRVLEYLGLEEARYRDMSEFSTGMKQRVKLAQGLVHGPDLLFLDEPTSGLDPTGRDEMLDIIEDVAERGIDVVMSSHVLHEVEQVCDRVLMLNEGRLVHYGEVSALTDGGERVLAVRTKTGGDTFAERLRESGFEPERDGARLRIPLGPDTEPTEILELAVEHDVQLREFMPAEWTLEAAFLDLLDGESSSEDEDPPSSRKRSPGG